MDGQADELKLKRHTKGNSTQAAPKSGNGQVKQPADSERETQASKGQLERPPRWYYRERQRRRNMTQCPDGIKKPQHPGWGQGQSKKARRNRNCRERLAGVRLARGQEIEVYFSREHEPEI